MTVGVGRRSSLDLRSQIKAREAGDDLLGFEEDGDDLANEAEDVFGVVLVVGIVHAGPGRLEGGSRRRRAGCNGR